MINIIASMVISAVLSDDKRDVLATESSYCQGTTYQRASQLVSLVVDISGLVLLYGATMNAHGFDGGFFNPLACMATDCVAGALPQS
jgi:hypothetical protein